MSQDPEKAKSDPSTFEPDGVAFTTGSTGSASVGNSSNSPTHFLAAHSKLVHRLFEESAAASWNLTRDHFQSALEASAAKQFATSPSAEKLDQYLGALHLKDLALACACSRGLDEAWEHFVATYRSYLRAAAGAILRCSAMSPAACDLADSLFADLYGLRDPAAKISNATRTRSLFRYFHGRSSLKTWLRAILAQRHVDSLRASRRFAELDSSETDGDTAARHTAPRLESPPDPHRGRYVALFTRALHASLAGLDTPDRERLRLYYAEDQTLAEIARTFGEHESSASRNLERVRRGLRQRIEEILRSGSIDGASDKSGLSDPEISLCIEYASEDAPIDLAKLLPPSPDPPPRKSPRPPS